MIRSKMLLTAVLAVGGLVGWFATTREPATVAQTPTPTAQPVPTATGAEAGIKAITADYAKAFNAGDAKSAAKLWTTTGEYEGADGLVLQGRDEIEKSLVEFFKANPKRTADIRIGAVKLMGRGLASVEGVVTMKSPGSNEVIESRYVALHTLEEGQWLAVSVSEWVPDAATDVSAKNLEWLVGEWTTKDGSGGEVNMTYSWDEAKAFLTGTYTVLKDGKKLSSGTQVIGKNPGGGLRSWMFDSSGTTNDGLWVRDDNRWVNDSFGLLPDGTEVYSVSVMIPLGPDAFTWQTTEREIDGVAASPLPPIKVTRVKK